MARMVEPALSVVTGIGRQLWGLARCGSIFRVELLFEAIRVPHFPLDLVFARILPLESNATRLSESSRRKREHMFPCNIEQVHQTLDVY